MRRLVPPSLRGSDPLAGREWEGYLHQEWVTIDGYDYKFYRHDAKLKKVIVEEAHSGILWWYDETEFLLGADHGRAPRRKRNVLDHR